MSCKWRSLRTADRDILNNFENSRKTGKFLRESIGGPQRWLWTWSVFLMRKGWDTWKCSSWRRLSGDLIKTYIYLNGRCQVDLAVPSMGAVVSLLPWASASPKISSRWGGQQAALLPAAHKHDFLIGIQRAIFPPLSLGKLKIILSWW